MLFRVSLEYQYGISIGLNHHVSSYAVNTAGRRDPFWAVNLLLYDESGKCRILYTIVLLLLSTGWCGETVSRKFRR